MKINEYQRQVQCQAIYIGNPYHNHGPFLWQNRSRDCQYLGPSTVSIIFSILFGGYNLCVLLHEHVYFFFVGAYIQPTHPYPDSPAADIYIDLVLAKGRIGELEKTGLSDVMALSALTNNFAEKR